MSSAVVTGLGVAAPNGLGLEEFWSATLRGQSGLSQLTRFNPGQYPVRIAGEVDGFDPADHTPNRLLPQTDHMTRMALAATDWALADAQADPVSLPEYDMSVTTASSSGGFEFGQRELEKLWGKGAEHVSAYQSFAWFYAVNTGQISIRHGMRGPSGVVVSEQAGGLDALAQARRQLRKHSRLVVSGAVDAALCPWGWVAQMASGRLSSTNAADRAYLPFDARACGYVPGEGGAMLVLEDGDAARDRGAGPVYGEIAGYGATFDPKPGSGREPGLRRAIDTALADAAVTPGDVDAVFADAAAVPNLDRTEAEALTAVFGPCGVPVTAPKTMTGRLYSGGGPLDVATALLSARDGVIPPTVNVADVDSEYDLDLVTEQPRTASIETALIVARGYGGFNSALVVHRSS